jgi:predicted RND superfamily exporter protein
MIVSTNNQGEIMKKIANLLIKHPIKTMTVMIVLILVSLVGVMFVELKTGNDTLVSDDTDIYLDNEAYQEVFGQDPIVLIYENENPFSKESIDFIYQLDQSIEGMDGIFSVSSPVVMIEQTSKNLLEQTELGLIEVASGLETMSNQLDVLSTNLSIEQESPIDLEVFTTNLNQLITAQETLATGLINFSDLADLMGTTVTTMITDLSSLSSVLTETSDIEVLNQTLQNLNVLNQQLLQFDALDDLSGVSDQTVTALTELLNNLSTLATTLDSQKVQMLELSARIGGLSSALSDIASNLSLMASNFNAFEPGFPDLEDTLDMILYEDGVLRSVYEGFLVDETTMRMVIVLEAGVTDTEIEAIHGALSLVVDDENQVDHVLISGKPILDQSIKSSMMDSMQVMMVSSVLIMIVILMLVYNVRMRLMPIVMIMIAVVATIGLMGWLNIGLTMVSMAVFPVLIGLGIDYFIQFQTRYEEEKGDYANED